MHISPRSIRMSLLAFVEWISVYLHSILSLRASVNSQRDNQSVQSIRRNAKWRKRTRHRISRWIRFGLNGLCLKCEKKKLSLFPSSSGQNFHLRFSNIVNFPFRNCSGKSVFIISRFIDFTQWFSQNELLFINIISVSERSEWSENDGTPHHLHHQSVCQSVIHVAHVFHLWAYIHLIFH